MNFQHAFRTTALLMLLSGSALALVTDPSPKPTTESAESQIRGIFRFPAFINRLPVHDQFKVEVFFTVDSASVVNFVMARSENERMKRMVELRMPGMKIKGLPPNVVHNLVLRFRKEL